MYAAQNAPSYFLSDSILSSVVHHAETGIVLIERNGRAIYLNDSARNILGTQGSELPEWIEQYLQLLVEPCQGR